MSGSAGGLYDGDPIDSATEEAHAPTMAPSTAGQVAGATFDQAFSGGGSARIARAAVRATSTGGDVDPDSGVEIKPPDPTVPKDQLNKQFGIPGVLSFDQDTTAVVAKQLYEHHVAEIQRQDIINRAPSGILSGGAARFVTGAAASLLDPVNAAATLVPGVPEARVAGLLGEAAYGAAGRLAVRAITGATQGIAGTAALQPLDYLGARGDHDDWDMGTALSNVFYGGLAGGVLHGGLGTILEGSHLPDWAQRVSALPDDLHQGMLKGALAAVAEDRPVLVGTAADVMDGLKATEDLKNFAARQADISGQADALEDQQQFSNDATDAGRRAAAADVESTAGRLTDLRATAEQYRGELTDAQDRVARAQLDPDTQQRLADIDNELSSTIPASRRLDLQGEKNMLLEGTPQPGDLENLRDVQQTKALQAAGARTEAEASAAQQRLDDLAQQGTDLESRARNNQRDFDRQYTLLSSKEEVTRAMAARTVRRYAGRRGLALEPGEADDIARNILAAAPKDTEAAIKKALGDINDRGTPRAATAAPDDGGDTPTADGGLQRIQAQTMQDAQRMANEQRGGPSSQDVQNTRAMEMRAKTAPEVSGADPAADLASAEKLDQQFQAFVQVERKAGRWGVREDNALAKIEEAQKLGDGDANAYKEITQCLIGKG